MELIRDQFLEQVHRLKRVNPMKLEKDQILEVFQAASSEVGRCLGLLLANVYSVDSHTFKSYKFKEVYRLYEAMAAELATFGQLDLYPQVLKLKVSSAN